MNFHFALNVAVPEGRKKRGVPRLNALTDRIINRSFRRMTQRASWSYEKDMTLLKALLEQKQKGNYTASGFRKQGWWEATQEFSLAYGHIDKSQLKNRFEILKKSLKLLRELRSTPGFQWNPESGHVTADTSTWDAFVSHTPAASQFRNAPFKYSHLLEKLVDSEASESKSLEAIIPSMVEPTVDSSLSPPSKRFKPERNNTKPHNHLSEDDFSAGLTGATSRLMKLMTDPDEALLALDVLRHTEIWHIFNGIDDEKLALRFIRREMMKE